MSRSPFNIGYFGQSIVNYDIIIFLELRNAKIYGLVEQKHLEDKEILRPEDLNFCVS